MIKIAKKRKKTKYGEDIRKFAGKSFRQKNDFAFEKDAVKQKKELKELGYLVRITKRKHGYRTWISHTPKSRKYEKEFFKRH